MQIINCTQSIEEAIKELRKIADALESGGAILHSGSVTDTKRYGEMREYGIEITIVTDKDM
jgi:ketol-acid reductoisomerase